MNTTLLLIGAMLFPVIVFVGYRYFSLRQASKGGQESLFKLLAPIMAALDKNKVPDQELIDKLADNAAVRVQLYMILKEYGKTELFPAQYLNQPAGAESSLVQWLVYDHPTGSPPEQIEFVQTVSLQDMLKGETKSFLYYLFKFKMENSPPKSNLGWVAGVAGPYLEEDGPYEYLPGTNSSFADFDAKTPEEHVQWAHESMKGAIQSAKLTE